MIATSPSEDKTLPRRERLPNPFHETFSQQGKRQEWFASAPYTELMRFALVGNEPEGKELARALAATGRHELVYAAGTAIEGAKAINDLEEVLADPAVEMVLVASNLANRPAHLRRTLQSERTVICLQPAGTRPESVYEAGMIQQDTQQVLLSVSPDAFHPAILRLKEFLTPQPVSASPAQRSEAVQFLSARIRPAETPLQVLERPQTLARTEQAPSTATAKLGELKLLEIELCSRGEVLLATDLEGELPCVPGWSTLRTLGGEVAEVSALAPAEELEAGTPVLITGRFEKMGLFQVSLMPRQGTAFLRLHVLGTSGAAELLFPLGSPGPAFLSWRDTDGELREESWDAWNPWPVLAELAEDAIAAARERHGRTDGLPLSWQDAVRAAELDDGVRRSVKKRRVSQMEYPEASEEVTFKGTMTLVGCALLWVIIVLVVLSRWVKSAGWFVGPILGLFLVMQLFRWIIPPREDSKKETKS